MIGERQKLINIADQPELGWSIHVVAEYMYNAEELADDFEDEERLEKWRRQSSLQKEKLRSRRKSVLSQLPSSRCMLCVQSSYWNHTCSFVGHADRLPGPEATRNDSLESRRNSKDCSFMFFVLSTLYFIVFALCCICSLHYQH